MGHKEPEARSVGPAPGPVPANRPVGQRRAQAGEGAAQSPGPGTWWDQYQGGGCRTAEPVG